MNRLISLYRQSSLYLGKSLFSPECQKRLLALHRTLPQELASSFVLFESTLGFGPSSLDYSFSVAPSAKSLAQLTSFFPHLPWQQMFAFLEGSADPTLGMEFDVSRVGAPDILNVFLSSEHLQIPDLADSLRIHGLAHYPGALKRCLEACCANSCIVHYCGFMLARKTSSVRLIVRCKERTRAALQELLLAIGYEQECSPLLTAWEAIAAHLDFISLSIDVGERIGERLGIECRIHPKETQQTWEAIFSHLSFSGLIAPEKAKASLHWKGSSTRTEERGEGGFNIRLVSRNINHLKLVFEPGAPLLAKIYLAAICQTVADTRFFPVGNFLDVVAIDERRRQDVLE